MAILPSIPGLSVTVQVRGVTAVEYDDPEAEERAVVTPDLAARYDLPPGAANPQVPLLVKYIEAEPNAPFAVRVSKEPTFERRSHHIAYELHLDGRRSIFAHEGHDGIPVPSWVSTADAQRSGSQADGYKRHKFVFSALNVVEGASLSGEALKHQAQVSDRCGTLRVSFYHIDWFRVVQDSPGGPLSPPDLGPAELSEKALKGKAIDCSASFVTAGSCGAPRVVQRGFHDPYQRPFAVFEFRYRFKEGLMREGIIPRPIPSVEEEEVDGTSQRPIHIKEENHRVPAGRAKQELASVEIRRGVKREPGESAEVKVDRAKRYKERRLENGRVQVDLTDD